MRVLLPLLLLAGGSGFAPAATEPIDPEQLAYNLKTTLQAYESVGRTNAKWDAEVKKVLTTYARILSWTNDTLKPLQKDLRAGLGRLATMNCDDPLIKYLQVRFGAAANAEEAVLGPAFRQAAAALQKSGYPDIRKCYANLWAARSFEGPASSNLLEAAAVNLRTALTSPPMPPEEADSASDLLFSTPWWSEPTRWRLYGILEPALTNQWSNSFVALLAKGRGYLSYAWEARGTGYAKTVSSQSAGLMAQRLDLAAQALEAAWQVKHDTRVCLEMMRVELGQAQGRTRLDLWFQRGMQLDPNNYDLCIEKLEYLRPRWYGNRKEMIDFGRSCSSNTNWRGPVRLLLADAHFEASREIQNDEERANYWLQPAVWADVKTTFEQFFKLYPEEVGYRHNYARYAVWCRQMQVFAAQVKLFPSTNYAYFGGVEQFNRMTKAAGLAGPKN
jgi:hypothetical protein